MAFFSFICHASLVGISSFIWPHNDGTGEMATECAPAFTLFSQLPTELRLKIWETALSRWCISKYAVQGPRHMLYRWHALGPDNVAIGQSCVEARQLIKKTYVQVVHNSRVHDLWNGRPIDWVDFNRHIFYTAGPPLGSQLLALTRAPWSRHIRHVVVSIRRLRSISWGLIPFIVEIAKACPLIQTVLVLQKYPKGLKGRVCTESDIAKTIETSTQEEEIIQASEELLQDLVYHQLPSSFTLGRQKPRILLRLS